VTAALEKKFASKRGKPPQDRWGKKPGQDVTFVNRELSKDETTAYRVWRESVDDVFLMWDKAVDDGYKFTIKYDSFSSSVACYMFPPSDGDNAGLALTGRGGSTYRACSEAIYKHYELFGGVWTGGGDVPSGPNDPDW